MKLVLRPKTDPETRRAWVVDSPFDDFGPSADGADGSASMDDAGSLVVQVDGDVAGSVSWHWRQWGPNAGSRCAMIGIGLWPAFHGLGIGALAQRQLVDLLFRHTTTNRVEAHTDIVNVAEQRVLERIGFAREGVIRGGQWRDGAHRDGYLYSVLRSEWKSAADPAG